MFDALLDMKAGIFERSSKKLFDKEDIRRTEFVNFFSD